MRLVSGKWKVCFRGRGNASLRAPIHPSRLAQGGWAGRPGDRAARGRGTCPLNASAAAAAFFPSVRRRGLHLSLATHAPQTLHTLQSSKPALTWLPLASPRPEGPVPERVRGILLGAVFVLRGGGQASARKKGIASLSFLLQVVPSGSEREGAMGAAGSGATPTRRCAVWYCAVRCCEGGGTRAVPCLQRNTGMLAGLVTTSAASEQTFNSRRE